MPPTQAVGVAASFSQSESLGETCCAGLRAPLTGGAPRVCYVQGTGQAPGTRSAAARACVHPTRCGRLRLLHTGFAVLLFHFRPGSPLLPSLRYLASPLLVPSHFPGLSRTLGVKRAARNVPRTEGGRQGQQSSRAEGIWSGTGLGRGVGVLAAAREDSRQQGLVTHLVSLDAVHWILRLQWTSGENRQRDINDSSMVARS